MSGCMSTQLRKGKMETPHIIFLHGMGEHKKEDFLKEFFTPMDKAAAHFSTIKPLSDQVVAHYIDYNELINTVRAKIKESTVESLSDKFPGIPTVLAKLNALNEKFGKDDSFWFTHVLDVVIYKSMYSDAIQASVGKQLVEAMQKATDAKQDIHIVCHSLGTAVGHDVLHKLYTNSLDDDTGRRLLSAGLNKIRSITMVANVCTLPITAADPYTSVVKPGPDGICDYFMTCRHVLDPFASLIKFVPGARWPNVLGGEFKNVVINGVGRANVHDMEHYFYDPRVYLPFFMNLYSPKFKTTSAALEAAKQAHKAMTIQGNFEALRTHMEDLDITLYWDSETGEFIYSEDVDTLLEKLSSFLELIGTIKDQIGTLTEEEGNDE